MKSPATSRLSSPGDGMKGAYIISAAFHLAVILFIVIAPEMNISFFEKPMRVNMIWVELPRGASDDIGLGLKKSESLPKSTIEEQRQLFQKEESDQVALKPKMTLPPEAEKAEKKEAAKPEKRPEIKLPKDMKVVKDEQKPKPKKSPTDKKISDALAKIDKQLANRQVVPEAAQIKENQEGYKYGTGTTPLKVPPSDPEYLKYQALVRAKIIFEWIVPARYTEAGAGSYNASVEVMINMDGEVSTVRWVSPSGDASFDQSAIRAVKKASPLPKPPDRLAWEAYNEGFLVEFDTSLKPRY